MATQSRSRWIRAALALAVGLAEPMVEIAWKCRAGYETTEACVWGRSYLPLGRAVGVLVIAPIAFGLLTVIEHLWRARRSRPPV